MEKQKCERCGKVDYLKFIYITCRCRKKTGVCQNCISEIECILAKRIREDREEVDHKYMNMNLPPIDCL